jgi:hypothetical protein
MTLGWRLHVEWQISSSWRVLMKSSRWLIGIALLVLHAAPGLCAQTAASPESSGASEGAKTGPSTGLKLQIVLSEYDGDKKISSLAYNIPVSMESGKTGGRFSSIRMGLRVPVMTEDPQGKATIQNFDVGTNIDARADRGDDGRYLVTLKVERTSLYDGTRDHNGKIYGKEWGVKDTAPGNEPLVLQYKGEVGVFVRDGQPTEVTTATDPFTGRVLKVELTLNVVK